MGRRSAMYLERRQSAARVLEMVEEEGARQKEVTSSSSAEVKGWERRACRWCATGLPTALSVGVEGHQLIVFYVA